MLHLLFLFVMFLPLVTSSRKLIPLSQRKMTTRLLCTTSMQSYQFIDSGGYKRIEQFGSCNVVRSCPSASWPPASSWTRLGAKITYDGTSGKAGIWNGLDLLDPNWQVTFDLDQTSTTTRIAFTLAASDLGQVGVFPEQQENWRWIYNTLRNSPALRKVLNGFAYTGGSTMAALSADNVQVVHLDAAKSSVQWAMRNAVASGLYTPVTTNSSNSDSSSSSSSSTTSRSVRWITDDCLTFLDREVRRGNTYEGLIFDPPAFGRGGNGKIWKLDKDLPVLAETLIPQLLSDDPAFVLLSCHDVEWSASRLAELIRTAVTKKASSAGARWLGGRSLRDHKEQQRVGVIQIRHDEGEMQSIALCGGVLEYGPMVLLSEPNDALLTSTSPDQNQAMDRLADAARKSQSQPLPLGGFARWRQLT